MNYRQPILILVFLPCCLTVFAQSQQMLEYKFRFGEVLAYQVELQDSIETTTQNNPVKDTETGILTYSLLFNQPPSDNTYEMDVTQDTLTLVRPPKFKPNLIEKQINHILNNAQEGHFTFSDRGKFVNKKALCLPIIFPLPEKPVSMNDIWNFEIEARYKENGTCQGKIIGEGIVYDLQESDDITTIILILNTQTNIKGNFKFREIHLRLSGKYKITESATHIVYFNVISGRVEKIISENNIFWEVDSRAMQSTKRIKRKATIKLVEP